MQGMSFGFPEMSTRDVLSRDAEIVDTLQDFGFIDNENGLSPEDKKAIAARMQVIAASHKISKEALAVLAFLDRALTVQIKTTEDLLNGVDVGVVSPLISDPLLASNEEFLQTVISLAKKKYGEGVAPFSDALFSAVSERLDQVASTKPIDGVIDGQDNVVQGFDKNLQ